MQARIVRKIMNESIDRKSPVSSTVKDPEMRVPTGVRWVVSLAVLVFANLTAVAFAQSSSCPGTHVKVLNIINSTGTVDCALFEGLQMKGIEMKE